MTGYKNKNNPFYVHLPPGIQTPLGIVEVFLLQSATALSQRYLDLFTPAVSFCTE